MFTLGVDLASQPQGTAGCLIEWTSTEAKVVSVDIGLTDEHILSLARNADLVAIDAPFGWPQPFIDFVSGSTPATNVPVWDAQYRGRLRFRRTDFHAWRMVGKPPLSVSSDKIAITAMRCSGLLAHMGVDDRSGCGPVVEVYPAATLRAWGFASSGYKAKSSASNDPLFGLVRAVMTSCPWLVLDEPSFESITHIDHAFDALIAALTGRVAALGLYDPPPAEDQDLARVEGWIIVPRPGTLASLPGVHCGLA